MHSTVRCLYEGRWAFAGLTVEFPLEELYIKVVMEDVHILGCGMVV